MLLSKRNRAFKEWNIVEHYMLKKREIKCEIKRPKSVYKEDLEFKMKGKFRFSLGEDAFNHRSG